MMQHLHREIEAVKKEIIRVASLVETNLRESIKALVTRDFHLAQEITKRDHIIDELEVEIEEECLKIFALYQPVAVDLRYLVAFLKLNNDLERIGDLACNIASRAASIAAKDQLEIPSQIPKMSELVQKMLKDSLDALVDLDSAKAKDVLFQDDSVDNLHISMYREVADMIRKDPEHVELWIEMMAVSRYLERVADHCTNIAEDVEYMVNGRIQRHQSLT
jgi:phosphate transport system protein